MKSACWFVILSACVFGQNTLEMSWNIESGPVTNDRTERAVVWRERVSVGGATSLQLAFDAANVGVSGALRFTGRADRAVQVLDGAALQRWQNHSAWFNGDTVDVELVLDPGETGRVTATRLYAGLPPTFPETTCGLTDDRVPTTEPRVARVVPSATINCGPASSCAASAFLISNASWIMSAQHVAVAAAFGIAEFNTPPSTVNGTLVHPGPDDQYPIDFGSLVTSPGGLLGDDWAVARLLANGSGQMPAPKQGWYNLATSAAAAAVPAGAQVRITGFGLDMDAGELDRNQATQTSTGPITTLGGTTLMYMCDTMGGNSGSPVVEVATGNVIAVHTNGGCMPTSGANSGCSITNAGLQTAVAGVCFGTISPLNWGPTLVAGGVGVANTYSVTGGGAMIGVGSWSFTPGPGWPVGITSTVFGQTSTTTSLQLTATAGTMTGVYTGGQLLWTGTCNGSTNEQIAADITVTVTTATPCAATLSTTPWTPSIAAGGAGATQNFAIAANGSTLTGGTWVVNSGAFPAGLTASIATPNATSTNVTVTAASTVTPGTYIGTLSWSGACNGSAATFGPVPISVDVVVPYPGSGEDFDMLTGVNAFPNSVPIKTASSGDLLTITFFSLFGTFDGTSPVLGAQAYLSSGPGLSMFAGFPEVHLSLNDPGLFIVFDGSSLNPLGPVVLQPGGMTFNFVYPGTFAGFTTRVQAFALSNTAMNGFFACTDAFEFVF